MRDQVGIGNAAALLEDSPLAVAIEGVEPNEDVDGLHLPKGITIMMPTNLRVALRARAAR